MVRVRIKSEGFPEDQDMAEEISATSGALDLESVPQNVPGNFLGLMQQVEQTQHVQLSSAFNFSASGNLVNLSSSHNNNGSVNAESDPYLTTLAALVQNTSSNSIIPMSALQNQIHQAGQAAPQTQPQVSLLQQLLQLQARQTQAPPSPSPGTPINQQLLALLAFQQIQGDLGSGPQTHVLNRNEVNVNPSSLNLGSALLALSQAQQPQRQQRVEQPLVGTQLPSSLVVSVSSPKDGHLDAGNSSLVGKPSKDKSHAERSKPLRETALQGGSSVIACRARGMPMDHNMHVRLL